MVTMPATVIDGGAIAAELLMSLREDIACSEHGAEKGFLLSGRNG
jgi:hypothetical protein